MLLIMCFVGSVLFGKPKMRGSVSYEVNIEQPDTHYFDVTIHIDNLSTDHVLLKMPVWTPGSYLVREYARNVERFTAGNGKKNTKLASQKIDKNTWQISTRNVKSVVVQYQVFAFDEHIRMSYLDGNHAFIMANTLLMYVDGLQQSSSTLTLHVPKAWTSISTALSPLKEDPHILYVPNYDILVDSPIEIGTHDIIRFTAAGVPHEIAMVGVAKYDASRIARDVAKIVKAETSIVGENPNERYTFIIHNEERGSGGLEHLSSTALGVSRWAYSNESSYKSFLSLVAHEYFHLWLVKRIRPAVLEKYDYDQEQYTDLLWFMEGVTSYFAEKAMLRCGFNDEHKFITNLLKDGNIVRNTPGAQVQSVADASFDAWIKFYRKDANAINSQISYYTKGTLLGALLDLQIMQGTGGTASLDQVISKLYYDFYKKKGKGITADDVKSVCEQVGRVQLDDFFAKYVYGTEKIDMAGFFALAGLELKVQESPVAIKSLGIGLEQGKNLVVKTVKKNSAAYKAGLSEKDEIVAINEYRVNPGNIGRILNTYKLGDEVEVLISRNGVIQRKKVPVMADQRTYFSFDAMKAPTKAQQKIYQKWVSR